jgi:uncharacterized protein (DUF58 family)
VLDAVIAAAQRARAAWRPVAVRPTVQGLGFFLFLGGVTFAAINTGNNLVFVILGLLFGLLLVSNVLAEWNLRNLEVARELPPEIRAGIPAVGHYVLINRRRIGTAWSVQAEELDGAVGRGTIPRCPAGTSAPGPATWTFPTRGVNRLDRVRLHSLFPFGLLRRHRDLSLPAEVLAWPGASAGNVPVHGGGSGAESTAATGRSDSGDFAGLRPYVPGDPARRVHWPTSARVGFPMVIVRAGEGSEHVVVEVPGRLSGEDREEAIRRAASRADHHLALGGAVGLRADGEVLPARPGMAQRRALLTTLALLEPR